MKRPALTLASFAFLLTSTAVAQAQTAYYVSTTGSDSNNGLTSSTAWATIQHAAQSITVGSSGATVHVAAGTYAGPITIHTNPGTASAPVTYISDTKWGAIINATSPSDDGFAFEVDVPYVVVENFSITGSTCGGIGLGVNYDSAIGNEVANTASGCTSGSNGGAGINDFGYVANQTGGRMIGNYVHDVGAVNSTCQNHTNSSVQGLYESGANATIENNLVVNSCQCGIQLWHAATAAKIVNNTIVTAAIGIIVGSGDAPCDTSGCAGDNNTLVINNIVVDSTQYGILAAAEDGGSIGSNNQYMNNLLYSNTNNFSASGATCSNCKTGQNPLFVNSTGTSSGNYQLQSSSPAIGAGTTTDAPSTDLNGNTRTAPITIGAYQFGASSTPPADPPSDPLSPPSSLVAYWKLDDGSGAVAADSSGNSNTMSLANSPAWQPATKCVVNGCLAFNGTNQSGSASLNLTSSNVITIAFWMKWTAFQNDDKLAFEFSSNFNNSTTGFLIDPDESSSGKFWVSVHGNAGYNNAAFARPSAGVWHHYAFVLNNGTATAGQVTPYVDGVAVPYTKSTYSAENTNNFGNNPLYVMSRDGSTLFGAGSLDEVYIYTTALSANDIAALAKQ